MTRWSACMRSWLNGFNLHWAWELLQKEHAAACAAIEDCRYPPLLFSLSNHGTPYET